MNDMNLLYFYTLSYLFFFSRLGQLLYYSDATAHD